MEISPIKSARDYRRALKEIEGLMTAKRGTAQGDRLDLLVTLVEAWEARHYPVVDQAAARQSGVKRGGVTR